MPHSMKSAVFQYHKSGKSIPVMHEGGEAPSIFLVDVRSEGTAVMMKSSDQS